MAITFAQQKRKQQYLLLASAGLIVAALGVVWWGFLREKPQRVSQVPEPAKPPEIQIDFQTLEAPFLREAEEFPEISPFVPSATGERVGRENPFVPYGPAKPSQKEK